MIKNESTNSPTPPGTWPRPPGFPPDQQQLNSEEPSGNQTLSGFNRNLVVRGGRGRGRGRGTIKYSSVELPRRRTDRKRVRPQFYAPVANPSPSATPLPRGRPPKARCVSQLPEIETRHVNEASLPPLRDGQELISGITTPLQVAKEQSSTRSNNQVLQQCSLTNISPTLDDSEGTLIDISLAEAPAPGPADHYKRPENVGRNDQTSQGIDPKLLLHVANALQYMSGNQSTPDDSKLKSRSSGINQNLSRTLKAINKKHGDITRDCCLESDYMKTLVLLGVSKVVQDLQKKQLKDMDNSTLNSYYTAIRDAENMKVNVQWLHTRLDEIKDAVRLTDEAKGLMDEKCWRLENVDRKKKELERLKSEVQEIEGQLAREAVMIEELNKAIGDQQSNFSRFQHKYLMDGLV